MRRRAIATVAARARGNSDDHGHDLEGATRFLPRRRLAPGRGSPPPRHPRGALARRCQYFPPVDEVAAALESRALELPGVASAELEGTNIELDARVDGTVTMASGATWQDATAVAVALTEAIDGRSERMRYRIDIELPNGETFTLDLTRR
ncbi:hypothetical protein USB125703_02079 [Pseudoclavibacter triregionum]|nr:hypothetical protein USB125703_02079 [Pseudoclavibacter triregionum]